MDYIILWLHDLEGITNLVKSWCSTQKWRFLGIKNRRWVILWGNTKRRDKVFPSQDRVVIICPWKAFRYSICCQRLAGIKLTDTLPQCICQRLLTILIVQDAAFGIHKFWWIPCKKKTDKIHLRRSYCFLVLWPRQDKPSVDGKNPKINTPISGWYHFS